MYHLRNIIFSVGNAPNTKTANNTIIIINIYTKYVKYIE